MKKRMTWKLLLSTKRVADYTKCETKFLPSQYTDPRSPFEKDHDQLTFSYPFRRLQDKTQVIPFPKYDFVHTRLTHSLEVASVGRSFGKMAADLIFEELGEDIIKQLNINKSDIGALVAAACLAHDIGNPPFGHSGEDSISHYFLQRDSNFKPNFKFKNGKVCKEKYDANQNKFISIESQPTDDEAAYMKKWKDLSQFEGNANGFRILTKNCDKGINPTLALLGVFTKYPRESFLLLDPFEVTDKAKKPKSQTKYGFFQEQADVFKFVANELGLIKVDGIDENDIAYYRHPLAFLMEASDDIAYGMIDFEDGCRLGLIDFEKKYQKIKVRKKDNLVKEVSLNKSPKEILISIAQLDTSFDKEKLASLADFKQEISYLRSKVINVLIHECFAIFRTEYENIMTGKFDKALLDCIMNSEIKESLDQMQSLVRKFIYNYPPVLESEASGFEVMEHLINSFAIISNICFSCGDEETPKDQKLRSLLPDEFQPVAEKEIEQLSHDEKYQRVLSVLDYISGMTDNYAISLYRKIKGISVER
ncbi:dGTP triphosphohydrolase [Parafilimonas sp.]|uniref:dGTP triphosphohydrolase n=1 Tax=Parafilimonas sp. TaxID=1969739 RepID=UPI0039E3C3A3